MLIHSTKPKQVKIKKPLRVIPIKIFLSKHFRFESKYFHIGVSLNGLPLMAKKISIGWVRIIFGFFQNTIDQIELKNNSNNITYNDDITKSEFYSFLVKKVEKSLRD